ncbi:hypothetical protein GWI33_011971 [Rhynchophorus ferrugineus]|uniref:Uncharacterized protein n=1 Tax=Rhynchophorus ferrugineus TaxID=354439 RepID=A0A834MLX1_RHYFE|nr:hypothetical protein GWI33_011971 [Rhynchophorus ferrugineus]
MAKCIPFRRVDSGRDCLFYRRRTEISPASHHFTCLSTVSFTYCPFPEAYGDSSPGYGRDNKKRSKQTVSEGPLATATAAFSPLDPPSPFPSNGRFITGDLRALIRQGNCKNGGTINLSLAAGSAWGPEKGGGDRGPLRAEK